MEDDDTLARQVILAALDQAKGIVLAGTGDAHVEEKRDRKVVIHSGGERGAHTTVTVYTRIRVRYSKGWLVFNLEEDRQ